MIIINGKKYSGNSISINSGNIVIDGKSVVVDKDEKTINIVVDADIESLDVDCCDKLEVTGSCGKVSSKNGNISVRGEVKGDVTNKNGNIICGSVGGDVDNKNGDIVHS